MLAVVEGRGGGGYLRDYTKGWEGEERVVSGGPPMYETTLAGFFQGT